MSAHKNLSLFTQPIDEHYTLGHNQDYNTEELDKVNMKDLENFLNKALIDEKNDEELNFRRFSSNIEFKNRKISDFFVKSWENNLKNLKEKTIHKMPFHSANVKIISNKKLFDEIPNFKLADS